MGSNSTSLDQCHPGPLHLWFRPIAICIHSHVIVMWSPIILEWGDNGGAVVSPCLPTLSTHAVRCIFSACFVLNDLLMDDNRQSKIAWRRLLTRFTLMWRSTISQLVSSHEYFIHPKYNQEASSAMNLQLEVNCSSCSWQVE